MLSFPVEPMKATLRANGAAVPTGDAWAFEIKWDGHRTIAHLTAGVVRFQTTSGLDSTERWPDVAGVADAVATDAILDGEMTVIGDDGRPDFGLTQQRSDPGRHRAVFQIFDVLQIGTEPTTDLAYTDRRSLLEQLVDPADNWQVPAHRIGGGVELLAATAEQGMEGIIAKRLDSTYRPGTRSKDWLKVKNRRRVELVVGGFTHGEGNRSASFGSLLVGVDAAAAEDTEVGRAVGAPLAKSALRFAGGVGTGFDTSTLDALTALLHEFRVDDCPFDDPASLPSAVRRTATWVRPELRVEVDIAEFTNAGHVRHAGFVRVAPGA